MKIKEFSELPGPWGLPILGSILDISGKQQGKVLTDWADEYYGPMFRFRAGSRQFVALQGYDLIKEALVTKANSFSGRMNGEIFDVFRSGKGLFISDMGNNFKYWHGFANQNLAVTWETFLKGVRTEAKHLESYLSEHLDQSIDLRNILTLVMMNSVMKMSFSKRYDISTDKAEELFKKVYESVIDPKWTPIIFLPWLKHFPSFQKYLSKTEKHTSDEIAWIKKLIKERRNNLECNSIDLVTCYEQSCQEIKNEEVTSEDHLATFIADLLFAGSSTTANQLLWTLLFLLKNPTCMVKVQNELNSFEGTLTIDNLNRLQYTRAVLYETLRLRPVAPTGSVHKTTQETHLMGYKIPKGTNVIANLWSVHMDKKIWGPDADVFRPERHLHEDGTFYKSQYVVPYSMGLRKCVGERLANVEIITFLVSIISKFEVKLAEESKDVDLEGVPESIFKSKPFKVIVSSRHKQSAECCEAT